MVTAIADRSNRTIRAECAARVARGPEIRTARKTWPEEGRSETGRRADRSPRPRPPAPRRGAASLESVTPEHFHRQFDLYVFGLLLSSNEAARLFSPWASASSTSAQLCPLPRLPTSQFTTLHCPS